MIMGDFNLIRSQANRNRPSGNVNNMMLFNSPIQLHDLEEIPLKGRAFTWSNMQDTPLLEKLDWIFTSSAWTSQYPNTSASPMARLGSDHIPIIIQISTKIPKSNIFRFEKYWLQFDGFKEIVEENWVNRGVYRNCAQDLVARFKSLRHGVKNGVNIYQTSLLLSITAAMLLLFWMGLRNRELCLPLRKTSEKLSKSIRSSYLRLRDYIGGKGLKSDGQHLVMKTQKISMQLQLEITGIIILLC
jgi:hypothetical protein